MFRNRIENWFYGGYDRKFFDENKERIDEHNMKYSGILIAAMCLVTLVYFLLNLKPLISSEMRISCLIFFLVSASLHMIHVLRIKKHTSSSVLYFFFVIELVFVFLLFVGPILDPNTAAVYLPVYFFAVPIIPVIPWNKLAVAVLVNIGIFAAVAYVCKSPDQASFDLINTATCAFFGIIFGNSVLRGRLNELDSYAKLKERSESELSKALIAANTDPLTGVRSRAAYEHVEKIMNDNISAGSTPAFGLVVCDINWLKETNDTYGHDVGDRLIKACCKVVCDVFAHSPVFRIGGDEFAVLLQGEDYENRRLLMECMGELLDHDKSGISLARGLSVFNPGEDSSMDNVFVRADSAMYENKNRIKASRQYDESIYAAVK